MGPRGFHEATQTAGCLAQNLLPPYSSILLTGDRGAEQLVTCPGLPTQEELPTPDPPTHHNFHGWTHLDELQALL